jgi:hypothetical protein
MIKKYLGKNNHVTYLVIGIISDISKNIGQKIILPNTSTGTRAANV